MAPKEGLGVEEEKALAAQLAAYKAGLTADEVKRIVADTKALHAFQDAEDAPEDIARIPVLTRGGHQKGRRRICE